MSFDPREPFTRKDGLAAGLSDRHLHGPRFRRLLQGVFVAAEVERTPLLMARAALLTHPVGAVASHYSAARALQAPVSAHPFEHVTVPTHAQRRQRLGVRCHVAALDDSEVRTIAGVRITAPVRLFLDMASELTLVDLVVLGDWLVRKRLVTPQALVAGCRENSGRHVVHARRAAAYVRAGVDSPMETRLRLLLVLAGLPEPEVNVERRDDHGSVVMRLDLSYRKVRLAVEYDGRHPCRRGLQWERDIERREVLDEGSWRLIVVTSKGIYKEPERTIDRVWRALHARGWRPLPRPRDDWRPHFPC